MAKDDEQKRTCLGFFTGDRSCQTCKVTRKCKALLLSDGFPLAESLLEGLVAGLSPEATFRRVEEDPDDPKGAVQGILEQIFAGGAVPPDPNKTPVIDIDAEEM